MKYYVGKGTEFKKEECKEYKTLEGAMKAAAKDEELVVWDETGNVVGSVTNNVPEGALETNPDGSVNTYDENGNLTGTISAEEAAALTGNGEEQQNSGEPENGAAEQQGAPENNAGGSGNGEDDEKQTNTPPAPENGQNEANSASNSAGNEGVIIPQGNMRVTVICDGALNLRRSAAWGNNNICGRAVRGQRYNVRAIHTVAGKKMVETIDGLFLSGQSEHVQFEQL